jgi:hypothetical protein
MIEENIIMTLEERFIEFVRSLKNAEIVDELPLSQAQQSASKPDFFFHERQFIGEMKSVHKDMEPKAQSILEKHQERPEYPIFFGKWDADKVLNYLPDGEDIQQNIFYAITSAIEGYADKANRQIREAKNVYKISSSEGILIIINDIVEILSPDIIAYRIQQLLNKKYPSGETRYPHISVAWVVTETHVVKTEIGLNLLPSITVVNNCSPSYQEAIDYVHWMQRKWASFNKIPFVKGNFDIMGSELSKINDNPTSGMIPRHELWRKQYAKAPYLRNLSEELLLTHGQEIFYEIVPGFVHGTHNKPPQEKVFELFEKQTHFFEEINHRGIDLRKFSPNLHEAAQKLQEEGIIEKNIDDRD